MSRRRMILLGLTILSAVGFLVDRFVLSPPASVEAASPARKPARKPAPVVAAPVDDNPLVDSSLAYLDRLDNVVGGRDVFCMSTEMMYYYKTLDERLELEQPPLPRSAKEFSASHQLEGTGMGSKGPLAVINGEVLQPGDQIDGFRLTGVTAYAAELYLGPDRVVLKLPRHGNGPRDAKAANKRIPVQSAR